MVDLNCKIGNYTFANPVFVASGTFGYGIETSDYVDLEGLGAIISKSITLHPREGNPPPRLVETSSGLINSIGLANVGVRTFIDEILPKMCELKTSVIVNIAGSDVDEYLKAMDQLEDANYDIAGYEINISCPNVKKGGMEFGVDPEMTETLTMALRKMTDRLLILKLSPNVTSITDIARAAVNGGADALSAINTVVGMSINPVTRRSNIHTRLGGLSGPAIKPVGIAAVFKISQAVNVPVIGIGGITCARDVAEYFLAGASAVQVGTANFRNPEIGIDIVRDFEQFCESQGITSAGDLTGKLIV